MLLVVLGHTMSGTVSDYSGSFLFQVIWTLQMPLFIIISGYVTRYSKPIDSLKRFGAVLGKRTLAYLLPWAVWTFLVRGFIFQQTSFFDVKYLFWHMDIGYWFLITIWTINVIYLCVDYCSNKLSENPTINTLLHLLFSGIGMVILAGLGYLAGFSFFSIKLTLYYIPFYVLGYLYGRIQEKTQERENYKTIAETVVGISLVLWITLIVRYDFFTNSSGMMMALRFVASLFGCIAVIGLLSGIFENGGGKAFAWSGVHSLEIYLTHYLFLNLVTTPIQSLCSLGGTAILTVNYALTISLVVVIIKLVQQNKQLNFVLYARRTK